MHYDIVIIGAGPAGLSAAYTARNAKVLVIEKDSGIGINIRTSGVSWIKEMREFGIPKEYFNPLKRYNFYSRSNTVTIEDKEYKACVLDVRRVYQYLAELASDNIELMLNTKFVKVLRDNNKINGIVAKRFNKEIEIRSTLVIDASGFNSVILNSLGLRNIRRYGVGAEYECYANNIDNEAWDLMVGSMYTPAGYAWIFPVNEKKVRIGVGVSRPESNADPLALLDNIIKNKVRPIDKLSNIKPIELHYGFIPNEGLMSNIIYDGLLIVGDSAGQANPLVLEGIRYAIEFGRLAGNIGIKSLEYNSTKESLKEYEDTCKRRIKREIDAALRVQRKWLRLNDEEWDKELDIIRDMSINELIDFIRADFSITKMLRLAKNHPKLIARELFNIVIND